MYTFSFISNFVLNSLFKLKWSCGLIAEMSQDRIADEKIFWALKIIVINHYYLTVTCHVIWLFQECSSGIKGLLKNTKVNLSVVYFFVDINTYFCSFPQIFLDKPFPHIQRCPVISYWKRSSNRLKPVYLILHLPGW